MKWRDGQLQESYVYIVSNSSMTLYTGVTTALTRRIDEHRDKEPGSFTSRYHFDRLVYYERFTDVRIAIEREKQIKGWTRKKKLDLIRSVNPEWRNLREQETP